MLVLNLKFIQIQDEKINGTGLLVLSVDDLQVLGVKTLAQREALRAAIDQLKKTRKEQKFPIPPGHNFRFLFSHILESTCYGEQVFSFEIVG